MARPPEETVVRTRRLRQRSERPHDQLLAATGPTVAERPAPDAPGRAGLPEEITLSWSAALGPTTWPAFHEKPRTGE